jgi:hypothetical protein
VRCTFEADLPRARIWLPGPECPVAAWWPCAAMRDVPRFAMRRIMPCIGRAPGLERVGPRVRRVVDLYICSATLNEVELPSRAAQARVERKRRSANSNALYDARNFLAAHKDESLARLRDVLPSSGGTHLLGRLSRLLQWRARCSLCEATEARSQADSDRLGSNDHSAVADNGALLPTTRKQVRVHRRASDLRTLHICTAAQDGCRRERSASQDNPSASGE